MAKTFMEEERKMQEEEAAKAAGKVFHAGTALNEKNEVITSGGRVLAVTSFGTNFKEALATSYKNMNAISFEGINYRKDLGFDL